MFIKENKKYDAVSKQLKAAETRRKKAGERVNDLTKQLDEERKKTVLICECGAELPISNLELIINYTDCHTSYCDDYNGNTTYRSEEWIVCPKCTEVFKAPTDYPFEEYYRCEKYVKKVHKWHSYMNRCHGRVLELLTPHFERQDKIKREEEKQRKIKEARRVLKEAGEL